MKSIILAALFLSASAFADNREIALIDPGLMTLKFIKTVKLPKVANEEDMPVVKAGLPMVKGKTACVLVANAKVAKKTEIKAGTVLRVEGISVDMWADTGMNIIKPKGWGLGLSCVSKFASIDAETGYPETSDPRDNITVDELKAAMKGVIEVNVK